MRSVLVPLLALALLAGGAGEAAAAEKNGITPVAPTSSVPAGKSPTFRMRVTAPGTVWVHVCRSAKKRPDGTICSTASIGQASRRGGEYRYKPRYFSYPSFWLNTPGTYYWQAHRIDCEGGTEDCKQEGPVVRFRVRPRADSAQAPRANRWLTERVINFAHQGGEDELPSNTMYALETSLRRGAEMLEIDVGATRDGRLVVMHDNKLERTTDGSGSITDLSLAEIQRFDAAYWFVPGVGTRRGLAASRYRFRGVRTGARRAPRGFSRNDFRVPSLDEVLRAFPRTPMNIEIKGRDGGDQAVYRRTAELLAAVVRRTGRTDIVAASFEQSAVDRFHELAPRVPVSPGIDGAARFILSNQSPGEGVVAFQVPITFEFGGAKLVITTPDFVKRAHEAGYAVHVWLSNDREDDATYRRLLRMCVDGIMAAKPSRLDRVMRSMKVGGPERSGLDPCGTTPAVERVTASGAGRFALPMRRQGLSMEKRTGTVKLVGIDRSGREGVTMGTGRFSLDSGASTTDAAMVLNAAGRAAVRGGAPFVMRAIVSERGRVVSNREIGVR
jgi:glycerophosphoryl diester phosphodiesterase